MKWNCWGRPGRRGAPQAALQQHAEGQERQLWSGRGGGPRLSPPPFRGHSSGATLLTEGCGAAAMAASAQLVSREAAAASRVNVIGCREARGQEQGRSVGGPRSNACKGASSSRLAAPVARSTGWGRSALLLGGRGPPAMPPSVPTYSRRPEGANAMPEMSGSQSCPPTSTTCACHGAAAAAGGAGVGGRVQGEQQRSGRPGMAPEPTARPPPTPCRAPRPGPSRSKGRAAATASKCSARLLAVPHAAVYDVAARAVLRKRQEVQRRGRELDVAAGLQWCRDVEHATGGECPSASRRQAAGMGVRRLDRSSDSTRVPPPLPLTSGVRKCATTELPRWSHTATEPSWLADANMEPVGRAGGG